VTVLNIQRKLSNFCFILGTSCHELNLVQWWTIYCCLNPVVPNWYYDMIRDMGPVLN